MVAGAETQQEGLAAWLSKPHVNAELLKTKYDSLAFN